MRSAGIDIGSRTVELVIMQDKKIEICRSAESGIDPCAEALRLLDGVSYDCLTVTGYGRTLFQSMHKASMVTEIRAYAVGATYLFPAARTVLDIGGQDYKLISLDENGKVRKFEMNDRCAAGTGKFLEMMAQTLGYTIDQFGSIALKAVDECSISSMCTVFAESEVVTLIARGVNTASIARGLHRSVVRRMLSLFYRIPVQELIVFAGGVAQNECIKYMLQEELGMAVHVPDCPQFVGAIGAALENNLSMEFKS